ncbi:hypothetical protein C943_02678 [Mariniradius saccharolyticus AK6]|uniref:Uncharacterized protein n=1 Tax=Mariniradius saccharolyticus AK6 TaxID=1239962 RepID=M7X0Q1_9BACT|nr:hypothetical protein C943_02678 [Mariniradius saccharolyticus AK6]
MRLSKPEFEFGPMAEYWVNELFCPKFNYRLSYWKPYQDAHGFS